MNKASILFPILVCVAIAACESQEERETPLFELLPAAHTGVDFANTLTEDDSLNVFDFDYMYNGGGVAVADFNKDGLPDLFFTANAVSSRLYLNKGNMQFQDVTAVAGLTTKQWAEGVTLVDINNDGFMDIYVSTSSGYKNQANNNLLFVSQGTNDQGIPIFIEQAEQWGIADTGYNTQAAFFDYDKDGDLDLYVLSNAVVEKNRNKPRPRQLLGEGKSNDKLYRNNGDNTFTNVSAQAGILVEGYGLGLAISDINKDGWPDIYVANDFITNDILYINNRDGTFSNKIEAAMKHQSMYGMGTDVADYNNDGLADIIVMDMMPDKNSRQKSMFPNINYDRYMLELRMDYEPQFIRNTLQLNNGPTPEGELSFSEVAQMAGVYKTDWSWAPLFADFDNDGLRDLFISNGYGKDVTDLDFVVYSTSLRQFGDEKQKNKKVREEMKKLVEIKLPNFIYKNKGDLTFADKSSDWGFVEASLSNGAAYADLDGDGDLDLVINNVDDAAFIYQNNSDKINKGKNNSNYLKIAFKGDSLNLQGLGTKVTLKYKAANQPALQYYEHYLTRGYKSTVHDIAHFGLGNVLNIDTVEVLWPDGKLEVRTNVKTNQLLAFNYKEAHPMPLKRDSRQGIKFAFDEVKTLNGLEHTHQSSEFVDFKYQPLQPHKFTEGGPALAVGDLDGNGLEDLYVGGSYDTPGVLFLQASDGNFSKKQLTDKAEHDDMGALFFDANGDGAQDLYVVSGGSRNGAGDASYQDRLYMNDGKGNLNLAPAALPKILSSGSVVTAADFDQDGDLDLFVGGRIVPHQYPLPASSHILRNDGGRFTDVTKMLSPDLEKAGLVTAAIWSDFNGDQLVDIIFTGEWMPITVYQQEKTADNKRTFKNVTEATGLATTSGWWNSITAGDFDGDGDVDYVAGNLGLNSRYKASVSEPVSVFAKDYDKSGSIDPIMFYYIGGENYPAHPRDALIDQIAAMRGRFPRYADYGSTPFDRFFADGELDDAYQLKAYEFKTSLIENKGKAGFALKALPISTQFAPISGILAHDFNQDGRLDLLLTGNNYSTETHTGRYDASIGHYLLGDGKGNFKAMPAKESGFYADGDTRAMASLINSKGERLIIVSEFANKLKVYKPAEVSTSGHIYALPNDQRAELYLKGGRKISQEFYYGNAYLSQSSRSISLGVPLDSVIIYDYAGKSRTYHITGTNIAQSK